MRIRTTVAAALLVTLAGCGAGGDGAAKASGETVKKVAMDGALPRVAEGTPAPEALSDLRCDRDDKNQWSASGVVSNRTGKAASFQVTVHVGPADGNSASAETRRISSVQKNGSVGFEIDEIEARSVDGPCHVQVLMLATGG